MHLRWLGHRGAITTGMGYQYFDGLVALPENADAGFVSAEYDGSKLCLHLLKAVQPVGRLHTRIIVY